MTIQTNNNRRTKPSLGVVEEGGHVQEADVHARQKYGPGILPRLETVL